MRAPLLKPVPASLPEAIELPATAEPFPGREVASRSRRVLPLFVTIGAALAVLGVSGTTSVAPPVGVETRVGAINVDGEVLVERLQHVFAGQDLDAALDGRQIVVVSGVVAKTAPGIKAGSAGGETAGKAFHQSVEDAAQAKNPRTYVYCRMETSRPQVDHVVPRARGGNATLDNAQTTCPWCNASKGARDVPVNPPPGFEGAWPPAWWPPR